MLRCVFVPLKRVPKHAQLAIHPRYLGYYKLRQRAACTSMRIAEVFQIFKVSEPEKQRSLSEAIGTLCGGAGKLRKSKTGAAALDVQAAHCRKNNNQRTSVFIFFSSMLTSFVSMMTRIR